MTPFRPLPVLLSLLLAAPAAAQVRDSTQTPRPISAVIGQPSAMGSTTGTPNYDVVLEVPRLTVDSIGLDVANLQAHLALNANAMNLVVLNAGVDVGIERVKLDLTGVGAQAYLYVDLDNVARIVDRVIATLNRNPEIVTRLLTVVDTAVGTVAGVANTALQPGGVLSRTVNSLGQTVQRTVDQAGNLVEQTTDAAGKVVNQRTVGSVLDAGGKVLQETTNAAGQTVRRVQDSSGAIIEYTLDKAGKIVSTRVLRQGGEKR